METEACTKCGDLAVLRTIKMDDGEYTSTIGAYFCDDCYDSLFECIVEMVYLDEQA